MISQLTGTLVEKDLGSITVDVSGVGYGVRVSKETLSRLPADGKQVTLFTYLAVRENAMDLYGFSEREERSFFKLLIEVPGIGPKSALAILSLATVETLRKSITSNDTTYLTKVSGIGKKSAEKIVLELKDKLGAVIAGGPDLKGESDAVEALRSLGYSLGEARDALKEVDESVTDTGARVKEALKILGNGA